MCRVGVTLLEAFVWDSVIKAEDMFLWVLQMETPA